MSDILNTLRAHWRIHLVCVVLFALITVPLGIAFRHVWLHRFDASRPYVPELKKLADQTPVYPGFQKINDDDIFLMKDTASLKRSFRTDAQSADIKKFYDSVFLKNGWDPSKTTPSSTIDGELFALIYNRDEYQICVNRRMSEPDIYDIWYLWAER
jgi:hypothetical protein